MCWQCAARQLESEAPEFDYPAGDNPKNYYWEVWHVDGQKRVRKQKSTPQLLTQMRMNTLDQRLSEDWYRRLRYQQGAFYVYRYVQEGKSWIQESCNRGDIASGVVYRC